MNVKVAPRTNQSSSSATMIISTTVSRTSPRQVVQTARAPQTARRTRSLSDKDVEKAVYAYIRAVRALGRETINTLDISRALSIPLPRVEKAAERLESKGVRLAQ